MNTLERQDGLLRDKILSLGLSLDTIHESSPPTGELFLGGIGTRLMSITHGINKHLLDIAGKPMALHGLELLERSGITNIIVICRESEYSIYEELFRTKKDLNISYVVQDKPLGTAHAFGLCANRCNFRIITVWGDNIFGQVPHDSVSQELYPYKGRLLLTQVQNPQDYAVVEFQKGKIREIIEKPKNPNSHIIATGFFVLFSDPIFRAISDIHPNAKGEFDIIDAIRSMSPQLDYRFIQGWWKDAGSSISDFQKTTQLAKQFGVNKT